MSEPSAKLDHNPLIVALANAVTQLNTDGTGALRRWTRDRSLVDQINQLAKDADLTDSPVIEIDFDKALLGPDGWKHPDRWRIQFNHPVPTRNPILVHLGNFPPHHARAALPEIVKYLGDWQTAAAKAKPGKTKRKPPRVGIRGSTDRQKEAKGLKDRRFTHAQIAEQMGLKDESSVTALLQRGEAAKQRIEAEVRREQASGRSIRPNVSLDAREGGDSDE